MKNIPAALLAHIVSGSTSLATALKITREDGEIFGFTSHDEDAEIDGVTYSAEQGLDVSDLVIASSAAVGNLELTTLNDGTLFTEAQVFGGVWRAAEFEIFRYNWADVTDGVDVLLTGTLGEIEMKQNMVVVELRDLRQFLQQSVGSASSKTCRYRLGSTDKNDGGLCMKDISGAPFTVSFTVTSVTSNQVFRDNARTEDAAWFDEGEITWLTGNNEGVSAKVKDYLANGTFTLALPMFSTVQVGDTGTAVAGCRKRLQADCRDKFDNVINFGGEPHRQGTNDVIKPAQSSV